MTTRTTPRTVWLQVLARAKNRSLHSEHIDRQVYVCARIDANKDGIPEIVGFDLTKAPGRLPVVAVFLNGERIL